MRDLTDRKLVEEEIRQDNKNLENRVRERSVELSVANEQVRREIQEHEQTQAELHQSEEQYRQLVELCPDAIFIQSDGLIVFVNSAAVKLFGAKSREELIGRRVLELVHPEYRETVNERIQQLNQQKSVELIEENFLRLDGSAIDVEVATAPLTYQNQPASQVIARDISPRKQAEAELRKTLERERELSELKSRIITVISHEYRTPLTTIQSSAELLENYSHKWTDEKKLTYLKRIQTSTKHMTNLVSDVLFIGQVEAHHIEFNPTSLDVEQFCRELVEQMSSGQKSQTTITFSSQGNCTDACLDERLLRQILSNLLSNAIKYSPESDRVRFDLECLDGVVRFSIQDSGIGIPAAEVPSLFESFHRASNVGTIPGTGLGLAIVKKCVDLHKGQITVQSEIGVGTTFTVTLPLLKSQTTAIAQVRQHGKD
jgi:PAS domain S-box-containing protein